MLFGVLPAILLVAASSARADTPNADFTAPGWADINTAVSFQAVPASGESVTHYLWDFGDGQTAQGTSPTVTHSYATGGIFHVTLTEVDSSNDIGHTEHDIAIGGPSPSFTPDSGSVLAGSSVQFDATRSTDPGAGITSFNWSFGDGATGSGARPTHVYMKPGILTISLRVTDSAKRTSTITHQLTVIAPPPIQTLIRTIVPAPVALKSGAPSVRRSGLADLGERVFCPGPGPACRTTVTPSNHSAAYTTTLSVAPNSSFELVLLLSRKGIKTLRSHGRLPVRVTIDSVRGGESAHARLAVVLRRSAKTKR
jgi:PKD repeat protein